MTTYALCDWERNGYDDSDFFAAYYDTESEKISVREIGSTRYSGGMVRANLMETPRLPVELVPIVAAKIAEAKFASARALEDRAVLEPEQATENMRTIDSGTWNDKKTSTTVKWGAGEPVRVFWHGAFGAFYRNGYNHPGRHNTRCGCQFADGRRAFLPLSALRLDREPASDDELRRRSLAAASDPATWPRHFGAAWGDTYITKAGREIVGA